MAGLLIDLQIAEIAEKTVKKIPHVLNDRDSGNWFSFSFILNKIQWNLGKQLFMVEKDLIASVCNRLNDVIIGYMEKASKFRDTVIIRVDCKHIATLQATGWSDYSFVSMQ